MVILKKKNLTNSKSYDKFCRKFIYTDKKGKKKSLFLPNIGIEVRIFDFDKGNFPTDNFDVLLSIYSLDYHYDFEIYSNFELFLNHTLLWIK